MKTEIKEKRCNSCQNVKPLNEFHNDRYSKDGKVRRCRTCAAAHYKNHKEKYQSRDKEYYRKNKDKIIERRKKYYANNPDKKEGLREYSKQASKKYLEKVKERGTPCVYALLLAGNLKYIGETFNLEHRGRKHIERLVADGPHANKMLQEEFDRKKLSKEEVTFRVLVEFDKDKYQSEESLRDALRKEEERQIKIHLEKGIRLYNVMNTHEKDRL